MPLSSLKVAFGFSAVFLFLGWNSSAQAIECAAAPGQVSALSVSEGVSQKCCSVKKKRARNRCFNRSRRKVRKLRPVFSRALVGQSLVRLEASRASGCNLAVPAELAECTDAQSFSLDEVAQNVARRACGKKLKERRQKTLKRIRRRVSQAKSYVGTQYANSVKKEIRTLMRSRDCGQGGEEPSPRCGRVVDPRDGYKTGNVYKLGDHDGKPVFITHNGARSGEAVAPNGRVIEKLRYTGLANPDGQGLRHHYRLSSSCSSLPSPYYLRLGSTCYEIDDRCGRID